jgi:ketosteroid isomerase-like protein
MSSTIGSDRQALQALAERMVAAELAGDAAFFEHVLAEDVVIMPPGIPAVEGLTPCLAFIRHVLAEIQREFERTITDRPAELTVHGNLALDRGAFEQTLVPKAGGQRSTRIGNTSGSSSATTMAPGNWRESFGISSSRRPGRSSIRSKPM